MTAPEQTGEFAPQPIAPCQICNGKYFVGENYRAIHETIDKTFDGDFLVEDGFIDINGDYKSQEYRYQHEKKYAPYFDGYKIKGEYIDLDRAYELAEKLNKTPKEKHLIAAAIMYNGGIHVGWCHDQAEKNLNAAYPDDYINKSGTWIWRNGVPTRGYLNSVGEWVDFAEQYDNEYKNNLDWNNYIKKEFLDVHLAEIFAEKSAISKMEKHLIACAVKDKDNGKFIADKDFSKIKHMIRAITLKDMGYINSVGTFFPSDDKRLKEYLNDFKENNDHPYHDPLKPEVINLELAREFAEKLNNPNPKKTEERAMREFVNATSKYDKDAENPYWFGKDL